MSFAVPRHGSLRGSPPLPVMPRLGVQPGEIGNGCSGTWVTLCGMKHAFGGGRHRRPLRHLLRRSPGRRLRSAGPGKWPTMICYPCLRTELPMSSGCTLGRGIHDLKPEHAQNCRSCWGIIASAREKLVGRPSPTMTPERTSPQSSNRTAVGGGRAGVGVAVWLRVAPRSDRRGRRWKGASTDRS
jgi:hypothetical protein